MAVNYTDKVMKHFFHPKNVGEIKNADGIGEVGNPVCLLPDEMVHKNSDVLKIINLREKEKVLSHEGKYEEILAKSVINYKGKILILGNKLGKINLTPEHLIYALTIPANSKFVRYKYKKDLIPSWVHAENLKKGDIILYPILKKEKDLAFIELNVQKFEWDFRSKELPKKVELNKDLLRLFGYFLAEGHIEDKITKTYLSFTLNIKEKEIAKDISKIVEDLFKIDVKIKEIPEKHTLIVFVYSVVLTRWFKSLFGNGAESKKLPEFIMQLPIEKQKSLIEGLWKGDGYVNIKRAGPRAGYVTISYQLVQQIKTLLLRQKIAPSIYIDKEKTVNGINHKKSYRIHIGQRDSLIRLCKILGIEYHPKSFTSVDSWFDNNYMHTQITSFGSRDYNGDVYNLEVDNAHSYTSEAFCVHNCGDIMKVYIKVGKRRKKDKEEKFIKNIKFKTLGCAAAIATSSMVTELAKGKSLEDAEKITRDDVASALGSLPPIKMHCSNLAADALRKAIKNYKEKNDNSSKSGV